VIQASARKPERNVFNKYGLQVKERYVELARPKLRVRVLALGEGPPVIMLPGLGAVAAAWAPLLAHITGLRLIAIDRPGCGLSDAFDFRGADLRRFGVDLVSSLIDALDLDQVSILGNSIGGTMALWFAIEHPDSVARLALLGAPPFVLDAQAPLGMRVLSIPFITRKALAGSSPAEIDRVFDGMGHPAGTVKGELLELVIASRALPGYVDGFGSLLRSATGLWGRRVRASADQLAGLRHPTLLIWGSHDTHGPVSTGRRMVATMPDARLEVCGTGHLPWLDDAAACAALVREFLAPQFDRT